MPPYTVYVGRPSKWGNPWNTLWQDLPSKNQSNSYRQEVLDSYREWLEEQVQADPKFLEGLRHKNLACWCPLNLPCHADILLEYLRKME